MHGAWLDCWSGPGKAQTSAAKFPATGARNQDNAIQPGPIQILSPILAWLLTGSFATSGTQNPKIVPYPGTLETSKGPPCATKIARVIASPIPDPLPKSEPRL